MNQEQHYDYTVQEWNKPPFKEMIDQALTESPKVVWDVGACVGGWSSLIRPHVSEVHAFEPFKDNYDALVARGLDVTAHNVGIYYGKRSAKAMWRGSNIGAIFVDDVDPTMAIDTQQLFDLTTLEDVDAPFPDLLKLDVEGAEKNIIRYSTMIKTIPQLIIEWHFTGVEDAKEYFKKYLPHTVVSEIEGGMFLLRL